MKNIRNMLQRSLYVITALLLGGVTFVPITVSAAGQATARSVTMNRSTPGATSVTYTVSFKATSASTIGGIIVDFCADTPLVGTNACTLPTGFTLGTSVAGTTISGIGGTWTYTGIQGGAAASNFQAIELSNGTPAAPTSFSATPLVVTLNTVTNPSTAGSFYARIITFDTAAHADTYRTTAGITTTRDATLLGKTDYGGAALSTAAAISLTARVMETLSFCVYTSSCGDSTAIEIGTGSPTSLDVTRVDTAAEKFSLSTNALTGALVNLYGDTLKSGSNSIAGVGTIAAIGNGSGLFGLKLGSISTTTGTLVATTNYAGTSGNYGFVTANTTNTAGGDTIANTNSLPATGAVATITYGASPSASTAAGIYTATHQLIATGTF